MKTINKVLLIAVTAASTFSAQAGREDGVPTQFNEATVAQLQAAMASGQLTSVKLTEFYLARIKALDQGPEGVNSIIELNPDALAMAQQADRPPPGRPGPRAFTWHPGAAQGQHRYRR
jgi:hypothetical protein